MLVLWTHAEGVIPEFYLLGGKNQQSVSSWVVTGGSYRGREAPGTSPTPIPPRGGGGVPRGAISLKNQQTNKPTNQQTNKVEDPHPITRPQVGVGSMSSRASPEDERPSKHASAEDRPGSEAARDNPRIGAWRPEVLFGNPAEITGIF